MVAFKIITRSAEETQKLGRCIGEMALPGDVYLLVGNLGAGKTCLTQGIVWGLGISEYALSPTFVLVRELYGRLPLYHIDLYRLDKLEEISDLGLDDYFYGRGVSVVEWAEKGLSLLPPEHVLVRIDYLSDSERRFNFQPEGKRYEEIVKALARYYN
jgi:tRNA threonylcarbamoyladenosine biosynthesis protein TsaE